MTIRRNSARCLECDTEIKSTHRHDYVSCPCGNLSVDGGHAYLKRAWAAGPPEASWVDTSDCDEGDAVRTDFCGTCRPPDPDSPEGETIARFAEFLELAGPPGRPQTPVQRYALRLKAWWITAHLEGDLD
jgi:hypothetical protein